jgi:lipopolysaccharide exporter
MTGTAESQGTNGATPPEGTSDHLAHRARMGMAWSSLSTAGRIVLEFGTSVALARLLRPEDFGIVAVGQAFLQLSYVVGNLGVGAAVIQAKALSTRDRHAATAIATLSAALLTLGCVLGAPATARFFNMPVLARAMPIMSLDILLSGLSATPIALLRRNLRYGRVVTVEIGNAAIYTSVSITLAFLGWGLWALVWAPLAAGLWTVVAAHVMARYRPAASFDREAWRRLLGFGSVLTVKNAFVHLARHGDNLVVAKTLGERATGLYTRAFALSTLPHMKIMTLIYGISFPVFCRVKDDRALFHSWYMKATAMAAIAMTPLLLGLAMVAREVSLVVYGEPWIDMATCLSLLCIAALLNSLHTIGGAAVEASGRLRYELGAQSLYGFLVPVGAFVGSAGGIEGVGWGVLGAATVFFVAKGFALRKAIGLRFRDYVAAPAPALAAGVAMCAVLALARAVLAVLDPLEPPLLLLLMIPLGAIVYLGALSVFGRDQLRFIRDQVSAFRARGRSATGRTPAAGWIAEDR